MVNAEKFWDKHAAGYAKSKIKNEQAYQASLARIQSYLSTKDDVLEVGCGTGSTALLLAPFTKTMTGTDLSPGMIAIANGKISGTPDGNVTFQQYDIEATRDKKTYNAVIALNLLHLVPDIDQTLANIHAQTRDGGLFISKTTCMGEASSIWRFVLPPMQWIGKAPFVRFFKIVDLEAAIENAGFEIVETGNFPAKPPGRLVVARKRT